MLRTMIDGFGAVLKGSFLGLIAGISSSFVYLTTRMFFHLPNSTPQAEITLDAKHLDVTKLMKCIEAKSRCSLPIEVEIDMDVWSVPLFYTTAACTAAGALFALRHYYQQVRNTKKNLIIFNFESEEETSSKEQRSLIP